MTKICVLNLKGEKKSEVTIPSNFEIKENKILLSKSINNILSNRRKAIAHTKIRNEVSGGGRKPFRQKGTGRARAGSTRSPLWIGGGVTFGPRKNRNYKKMINKKVSKKAIQVALNKKINDKKVIILEKLNLEKISTKQVQGILENLPIEEGKILVMIDKINPNLELSFSNIPYARVLKIQNINTYDLLKYNYLLIEKEVFMRLLKSFEKSLK